MVFQWIVLTVIASLSLVYGSISIYSIIKRLRKSVWIDITKDTDFNDMPRVAILLPLYRERYEDIELVFKSIAMQIYPRDRIMVVIALEKDDNETLYFVEKLKDIVINQGIDLAIVVNEDRRKSKAYALNRAISKISHLVDFVVVYDAGDMITDRLHIAKIAMLIKKGYDVIGSKVYRIGNHILGRLSFLDTLLWYDVALPGIVKLIGYPLVSGEGMAISMRFLKIVNGFPDKLTEDSYMTMLVAAHGGKAALLNTIIYEGAPSTLKSFIKQRLRWYRGYLECFKDLILIYRKSLKLPVVLKLGIAYIEPLALISTMVSFITIAFVPHMEIPIYTLYIVLISVILTLSAPLYIILDLKIKDPTVFIAPFYWASQGIIALACLLPIHIPWLRTTRTTIPIPKTNPKQYQSIDI